MSISPGSEFSPKSPLTLIYRSYRDRKDKYTKALEAELARSRRNEAGLASEVQQLRARVHILTTLLSQNGISLPPEFAEEISHSYTPYTDDSSPANEQAQTAIRPLEELQLDPASKPANQSSPSGSDVFGLRHHGSRFFRRPLPPVPTATITLSAEPSDKTHLSDLDVTTVGMEFVLTYAFSSFSHIYIYMKEMLIAR